MLLIAVLALAFLISKRADFFANPTLFPSQPNDDSLEGYPQRVRENQNEWSFAARKQLHVRLPHGPNPQQKYIQEQKFFDDERLQKNYRDQLRVMRIENQDWRLDHTTNSQLNNFLQNISPEDHLQRIRNFSERNTNELNENASITDCYHNIALPAF